MHESSKWRKILDIQAMKTPLHRVIDILEDLHDEWDGHTAHQQGILDCIDVCVDNLQYERDVIKHLAKAQRELYERINK
jgi:hypothetical protein